VKKILTKLAEVATNLDDAGYAAEADQLDSMIIELATQLSRTAEVGVNMSTEEQKQLAEIDSQETAPAPLPPSVVGKVVMRGKPPAATSYGFHGTDDIEAAVKAGKVDDAEAVRALQEYLKMVGYQMIGTTLSELINSAAAGGYLPAKGKQPTEVVGGPKGFWQKLFN
jgi:hypothetical protein